MSVISRDVKEFIEKYIDIIESHNWEKVCWVWHHRMNNDPNTFKEFEWLLESIGLTIPIEDKKKVIHHFLYKNIDYLMKHQSEWRGPKKFVDSNWAISELDHQFGLTLVELREVLDDVAKELSLVKMGPDYIWE